MGEESGSFCFIDKVSVAEQPFEFLDEFVDMRRPLLVCFRLLTSFVLVRMVLESMVHCPDKVIPGSEVDRVIVDRLLSNRLCPVSSVSCHASERNDDPAIIIIDLFDDEV